MRERLSAAQLAPLLLADSQEAMRVIREHDASIPLFYYIAFQCNHEPLEAPDGYIDM